ncbi:MAG: type secretion protein TolC [Gammaproteobacteria bacterium]|jgi:outer membrane protein|nr:type secretion protein TolC [Gammaproteobacteria bacterium]
MKRWVVLGLGLGLSIQYAFAVDLMTVYQQAVANAPVLKSDAATNMSVAESVPISAAALMPQLAFTADASQNQVKNYAVSATYQTQNYEFELSQQLLNINKVGTLQNARATAQAQSATYTSQQQSFILTVATDYFNILEAQDNVNSSVAQVNFLDKTLKQTKQKFEVGLATDTDLKQAEAQYDEAYATELQNENSLQNAYEVLDELTNQRESNLARLKPNFPFVSPHPVDVQHWIKLAEKNNAALQAQRYTTVAALKNVTTQVGDQLPTVSLVGTYGQTRYSGNVPSIVSTTFSQKDATIGLQLNWTVFQSGGLYAASMQAAKQYEASESTEDNLYLQTISQTKQDYLSVMANISLVTAYRQSVRSNALSLQEFEAKYKVGDETIVNVLNAVQNLYQAQQNFSQAEYQYILSGLQLKLDAGTLGAADLAYLNSWLQVSQ